jgi:hypothetical protein
MKTAVLCVALFLLTVLARPVGTAPSAGKPEDVGLSSQRLQRLTQMIQRRIAAGGGVARRLGARAAALGRPWSVCAGPDASSACVLPELRHRSPPSNQAKSAKSLGRPDARLLRIKASRPRTGSRIPSMTQSSLVLHASSNSTLSMAVRMSMRLGAPPSGRRLPAW